MFLEHKGMTFCTLLANQMIVEDQRLFFKLIHNIMLPIPTLKVWDKIIKLKLNVFPSSNCGLELEHVCGVTLPLCC